MPPVEEEERRDQDPEEIKRIKKEKSAHSQAFWFAHLGIDPATLTKN